VLKRRDRCLDGVAFCVQPITPDEGTLEGRKTLQYRDLAVLASKTAVPPESALPGTARVPGMHLKKRSGGAAGAFLNCFKQTRFLNLEWIVFTRKERGNNEKKVPRGLCAESNCSAKPPVKVSAG